MLCRDLHDVTIFTERVMATVEQANGSVLDGGVTASRGHVPLTAFSFLRPAPRPAARP